MKIRNLYVFGIVAYFLGFLLLSVQAQTNTGELKDRKITIKADNAPPAKVFQQLIYELGIPIGLEMSLLDKDTRDFKFETNLPAYMIRNRQPSQIREGSLSYEVHWERVFTSREHFITLDFDNAPIDKVFDSLVSQMSHYKWEIVDNVINIYPKEGRDPRFFDLMELEVKDYLLVTKASLIIIQTTLYDLPEFEEFLADRNLAVTGVRVDAQNLKRTVPHGVRLANVKLKGILNNLAKMKGGGWILRMETEKTEDGKQIIEIDI